MTLESAMHMIKPSVFRPVPTDAFMTDCPLTVIAVDGVKNEYYLACWLLMRNGFSFGKYFNLRENVTVTVHSRSRVYFHLTVHRGFNCWEMAMTDVIRMHYLKRSYLYQTADVHLYITAAWCVSTSESMV